MRTDDFNFELPRELIAARPAIPRDSARMLEVGEPFHDRLVSDLPELLRAGDVLVVNDTRVIPARLQGRRGSASVEITLHKQMAEGRWRAFARPARRLRRGDRLDFAPDFAAAVADKLAGGEVELDFGSGEVIPALERYGKMPLPPYIPRPGGATDGDHSDYQTVYAREPGAVAAPTAGLHFTDSLMSRITAAGAEIVTVTLHVGAGTFLPVHAENIADHRMHAEFGVISADAAARINQAREAGGRVVSVGTTSLRLIESAAAKSGEICPWEGDTDIFITPGFRFRAVDMLLTNFHLPRSTLFMLVCAFAGMERMRAAYDHAKRMEYRFYSYGDATLLHRADGP